MTRARPLLVVGFALLAVLTVVYWLLVYLVAGADGWFARFPYVSPVADTFMAGSGALAAWGLWRRRPWAAVAGLLSAGACVFVGLTAFHYNLRTGQLLHPSGAQLIEILVPSSLLLLGVLAIVGLRLERRG